MSKTWNIGEKMSLSLGLWWTKWSIEISLMYYEGWDWSMSLGPFSFRLSSQWFNRTHEDY